MVALQIAVDAGQVSITPQIDQGSGTGTYLDEAAVTYQRTYHRIVVPMDNASASFDW